MITINITIYILWNTMTKKYMESLLKNQNDDSYENENNGSDIFICV